MVENTLKNGTRVVPVPDHGWGAGAIVGKEMYKERLSRYKVLFDGKVPWKDNIGYFMPRELKLES